jgi:hypothetical protein
VFSGSRCQRRSLAFPGPENPVTASDKTMTIEHPMFTPREFEIYEPFAVQDAFCEALAKIERIGSNRRLVFVVTDTSQPRTHAVVANSRPSS